MRRGRQPLAHQATELAVDDRHVGPEQRVHLREAVHGSTAGSFGVEQGTDGDRGGVRRGVQKDLKGTTPTALPVKTSPREERRPAAHRNGLAGDGIPVARAQEHGEPGHLLRLDEAPERRPS